MRGAYYHRSAHNLRHGTLNSTAMSPVDWLPRWKLSRLTLQSPPLEPCPRRHPHCPDSEGENTEDARPRERKDSSTKPILGHRNRVNSDGEPPPTRELLNKRIVVLGAILGTIGLLSIVALSSARGYAALPAPFFGTNRKERGRNGNSINSESGSHDIRRMDDDKKDTWIRVDSAKAAHPAMYVPADGVVYCPIAKASTSVSFDSQELLRCL